MKTLDARLILVPTSQAKDTGEDVNGLADSMKEQGQLTMVLVDATGKLIKGNRRLLAAKQNGETAILGLRLDLEGTEAEQAAIAAQLVNRSQTLLKRAELFSRWKEIYETEFPGTKNGGSPKKKSQSDKLAFWEFANKRTGIHRRTIMRLVKIGRKIPADAIKLLHTLPIADHEQNLELLAKETDKDAVVEAAYLMKNDDSLKPIYALRKAKRDLRLQQETAIPLTSDNYKLIYNPDGFLGEMRKMPDGSINAIVTDPPWMEEYLPLLEPFAIEAARVLKPGGICLVMFGQANLPEAMAALGKHLTYRWILVDDQGDRGEDKQNDRKLFSHWKPILTCPPFLVQG
jgi:hypothetical protein